LNKSKYNKVKTGVLIFIKYPFIGRVKSRLSLKFGKNFTIALYQKFVEDLLEMLKRTKYTILICYYPPENLIDFKSWLGNDYEFIPQKGNDLGERLKNCFIEGFELGYNNLIVIGSDSPGLPEKIINESIEKLNDFDTVIGPCEDGGYYLIGFTTYSFSSKIFEGITWSTSSVFEDTIDKLKSVSNDFFILEKLSDIDTKDDLKQFYMKNINTNFKTSKTMIFLKENIEKL